MDLGFCHTKESNPLKQKLGVTKTRKAMAQQHLDHLPLVERHSFAYESFYQVKN